MQICMHTNNINNNNYNNIIFFTETRLQNMIGKIIKYRCMVNKLVSNLVAFESSP